MPKPHPISPLEAHLGYWLRFVSNHVSAAFAEKLAAQNVSVAEWVILRELYDRGPTPPSELAALTGLTRGAITKIVDRLIAKSLAARAQSPEDGRAQTVALTTAGRTLTPRLAALADRNDEEFFGHLKRSERDRLEAAMRAIVRRKALRTLPTE
jgi:DNA-binding MarR family transcriptional regulator